MTAVIVAVKFRKMISRFLDSGTTSPRNAKTLQELNIRAGLMFSRLLKREVIIEPVPGRYYLNEENLATYRHSRRIMALIILGTFFIAIMVYLFFNSRT
jgi:hypothetical protein